MTMRARPNGDDRTHRRGSGRAIKPGPVPYDDGGEGEQRTVSIKMSEGFARRLRLAAAIRGVSMREYVLTRLEPAIDEDLSSGLE